MTFKESKIVREIGRKKTSTDIESIRKEISEKYPGYVKFVEAKMNVLRKYTEEWKKKYPKLEDELEDLNKYAEEAGFKEVLIEPEKETGGIIAVEPLSNLIIIKERILPNIKILKVFAPDFLDKAIKHTLGNTKEKIPGHEREHLKNLSLKIYSKEVETLMKHQDIELGRIKEPIRLEEELEKLKRKGNFYAELQRMLKQPILEYPETKERAKEVIDGIALRQALMAVLSFGLDLRIEAFLKREIDKEEFKRILSESPSKEEKVVKGVYPYLKEEIINDVVERTGEILKELKEKYEKWKEGREK